MSETEAAFGRSETLALDGRDITILLAKNPTGANENIRTVQEAAQQAAAGPPTLLIILNDRVADGHDVSWIWDVDYESLLACASRIVCSGDRAHELGLRFRYSSTESRIDPDPAKTSPAVEVIPSLSAALDRAVSATPEGGAVFALPTYTATLELRAELTSRKAASPFWESRK